MLFLAPVLNTKNILVIKNWMRYSKIKLFNSIKKLTCGFAKIKFIILKILDKCY